MTGRNVALVLTVLGLVLAFLGGAYLPQWLRSPLIGAISGGFGVWMVRALSKNEPVRVVRWLPFVTVFGAGVGLVAALGAMVAAS